MGWLRVMVGVGVLWLISIVVTVAGLELAHRSVLASERRPATQTTAGKAAAISVGDRRVAKPTDARF